MAEPEARQIAYQAHMASQALQQHLTDLQDAHPGTGGQPPGGLTARDAAGIIRSALWAIDYLATATSVLASSAELEGEPQTKIIRGLALLRAGAREMRTGIQASCSHPVPASTRDFPVPPLSAGDLAAITAAPGSGAAASRSPGAELPARARRTV
jgi:hypothetical protein